jgi:hypothetical protein
MARDGREALTILDEDGEFDLLFTDYVMPGGPQRHTAGARGMPPTARPEGADNLGYLREAGGSVDGSRVDGFAIIAKAPTGRPTSRRAIRGDPRRRAGRAAGIGAPIRRSGAKRPNRVCRAARSRIFDYRPARRGRRSRGRGGAPDDKISGLRCRLPLIGLLLCGWGAVAAAPSLAEQRAPSGSGHGVARHDLAELVRSVERAAADHPVRHAVCNPRRAVRPYPGQKMGPSLAESWQESEDGLTYEFKLRAGPEIPQRRPGDDAKT